MRSNSYYIQTVIAVVQSSWRLGVGACTDSNTAPTKYWSIIFSSAPSLENYCRFSFPAAKWLSVPRKSYFLAIYFAPVIRFLSAFNANKIVFNPFFQVKTELLTPKSPAGQPGNGPPKTRERRIGTFLRYKRSFI